jgi:hypothetical protein
MSGDNTSLEAWESLIEGIYSKSAFLDFITKRINEAGKVGNEYTFLAGKNLNIVVNKTADNNWTATFNYFESAAPTITLPILVYELGQSLTQSEITTLAVDVTRGKYRLVRLDITGIPTPVNNTIGDMVDVLEGQTLNVPIDHFALDGDDELLATVEVEDYHGEILNQQLNLVREKRYFAGAATVAPSASPLTLGAGEGFDQSWLGKAAFEAVDTFSIDHGVLETFLIAAVPQDNSLIVYSGGVPMPMNKVATVVEPYAADLSFTTTYDVYTSVVATTGLINYELKLID